MRWIWPSNEGSPPRPFTTLVVCVDKVGGEILGDGRVTARFDRVEVDSQLVDDFSPYKSLPRGPLPFLRLKKSR